MESIDRKRFWLGAILMVAGVAMLFIAMFMEPVGEIHGTVLGAFGEISTIAGCILGLDSYVNLKMKKFIRMEDEKKNE